jgi:hypothetical protein
MAGQWILSGIFAIFTVLVIALIKSFLSKAISSNEVLNQKVDKCEKDVLIAVKVADCEEKREKVVEEIKKIGDKLDCFELKNTAILSKLSERTETLVDTVNKINNRR